MFEVYDIAVVPVIIALVEVMKRVGLPARLAPVASLVFGVVAGTIYVAPDDLARGVFVGLTMGLAASGLWSGAKNTLGK